MVVQLLFLALLSNSLDLIHAIRVIQNGTQCATFIRAFVAAYVIHPLEHMIKYATIFIMVLIARQQANTLRSPLAYQSKLRQR